MIAADRPPHAAETGRAPTTPRSRRVRRLLGPALLGSALLGAGVAAPGCATDRTPGNPLRTFGGSIKRSCDDACDLVLRRTPSCDGGTCDPAVADGPGRCADPFLVAAERAQADTAAERTGATDDVAAGGVAFADNFDAEMSRLRREMADRKPAPAAADTPPVAVADGSSAATPPAADAPFPPQVVAYDPITGRRVEPSAPATDAAPVATGTSESTPFLVAAGPPVPPAAEPEEPANPFAFVGVGETAGADANPFEVDAAGDGDAPSAASEPPAAASPFLAEAAPADEVPALAAAAPESTGLERSGTDVDTLPVISPRNTPAFASANRGVKAGPPVPAGAASTLPVADGPSDVAAIEPAPQVRPERFAAAEPGNAAAAAPGAGPAADADAAFAGNPFFAGFGTPAEGDVDPPAVAADETFGDFADELPPLPPVDAAADRDAADAHGALFAADGPADGPADESTDGGPGIGDAFAAGPLLVGPVGADDGDDGAVSAAAGFDDRFGDDRFRQEPDADDPPAAFRPPLLPAPALPPLRVAAAERADDPRAAGAAAAAADCPGSDAAHAILLPGDAGSAAEPAASPFLPLALGLAAAAVMLGGLTWWRNRTGLA